MKNKQDKKKEVVKIITVGGLEVQGEQEKGITINRNPSFRRSATCIAVSAVLKTDHPFIR